MYLNPEWPSPILTIMENNHHFRWWHTPGWHYMCFFLAAILECGRHFEFRNLQFFTVFSNCLTVFSNCLSWLSWKLHCNYICHKNIIGKHSVSSENISYSLMLVSKLWHPIMFSYIYAFWSTTGNVFIEDLSEIK